jgi:hypothetical protein
MPLKRIEHINAICTVDPGVAIRCEGPSRDLRGGRSDRRIAVARNPRVNSRTRLLSRPRDQPISVLHPGRVQLAARRHGW